MYTVYIIKSLKSDKYYTGHTLDVKKRIVEHNNGMTKSTKSGIPWELVYTKDFPSKSIAQHIELKIKRMKSRTFIEKLINNKIDNHFFKRP